MNRQRSTLLLALIALAALYTFWFLHDKHWLATQLVFTGPPLLLAMILEPIAEANFRRALNISQNDYAIFYTSPVACIILLVSLIVLLKPIYDDFRAGRKAAA